MFRIGDIVQFDYDGVMLYGEIVPFTLGSRDFDHSDRSHLITLMGFVDPMYDGDITDHGWRSYSQAYGSGTRYLWIRHTWPSLAYYGTQHHRNKRPVSPIFYAMKEPV